MTPLNVWVRPWAVFDVANADHRRWAYEFLATKSWARCPVRFETPGSSCRNLARFVEQQMAEYYGRTEFGEINR